MTLSDQLACAKRELALRRNVYPGWVKSGRMKQAKADHEIESMAAIVQTLERQLMLWEVSEEMKRNAAP